MAFDRNSNAFTFLFAIVMVVVVGTVLAVAFLALKPAYTESVRKEKMQDILASIGVHVSRDEAAVKYAELVKEALLVDAHGDVVEGISTDPADGDAFALDVLVQYRGQKAGVVKEEDMRHPVYRAVVDGRDLYVFPMVGSGLWGPLWGYVALEADGRTVYGATFDHQRETPGLGAEISLPLFSDPFRGKAIAREDGTYTGIKVYKGGTNTRDPHGVDGISGGTITSDGVAEMLMRTLAIHDKYLKRTVAASTATAATNEQETP